jgi:phosphoglycerate kinase
MNTLKKLSIQKGMRVLVRVDFNVPMKGVKIADPYRIDTALPTIQYLQKKGAIIILVSHFGDDGSASMKPVAAYLKKTLGACTFVPAVIGEKVEKVLSKAVAGDIILLENLRSDEGEKANDAVFAKTLASYADIYINEAFSVSHRPHASIVGLPKYIKTTGAGLQLEKEIQNLSKMLEPKSPFVFILGGTKFATKVPLLKKFMKTADTVVLGGILLNDVLKALGYSVGSSIVDEDIVPKEILKKVGTQILIPESVTVRNTKTGKVSVVAIDAIQADDMIVDVSPEFIETLTKTILKKAKTVLWNGPLGYTSGGYTRGTKDMLEFLTTYKGGLVIGGGDTGEVITQMKLRGKISFVSTGGGAALDYLQAGNLVGIKALK